MKSSILGIRKSSLLTIMAAILIACIALAGVTSSAALADDPDPYMYVDWPHHGSECDLYLDSGATGPIPGWCANKDIYIYVGTHYAYTVYDYYGDYYPGNVSSLPENVRDGKDWNSVTYIMNHIIDGADADDIQEAVWYFTDGFVSTRANSVAMVAAAINNNGDTYVPPSDGWKPIIVSMGPCVQVQFYMVDMEDDSSGAPPLPELPAALLFGSGVLGLAGLVWYRKRHIVAV